MFSFLAVWWNRRPQARLPHLHFVFFTRQGCHLCEDAWKLLESARARHGFAIEAIDVDSDPELAARHGDWVPVVSVNGKVRFRGGVNPVLLDKLLQGESWKR